MRVAVIGLGAVGSRAARQLVASAEVESVVLRDIRAERVAEVAASLGPKAAPDPQAITAPPDADAVILAGPAGDHAAQAIELLERDVPVVSVSDAVSDVEALLDLGPVAAARGVSLVIGAGFSPGLTCLLARHAARDFDRIDEIHVAKVGTGGPACARQHHHALASAAIDWRDGGWQRRAGGSGRELCWFPDPVGPADCYRAALPDALLLVNAFPGIERVTARLAATRRDRLTSRLPMLRPPHPEGDVGAVRVEVRGQRGGRREVQVLGVMDRPGVAAGAVSAVAAMWAVQGRLLRSGAGSLADLVEPVPFLTELATRGVRAAVFEGAGQPA